MAPVLTTRRSSSLRTFRLGMSRTCCVCSRRLSRTPAPKSTMISTLLAHSTLSSCPASNCFLASVTVSRTRRARTKLTRASVHALTLAFSSPSTSCATTQRLVPSWSMPIFLSSMLGSKKFAAFLAPSVRRFSSISRCKSSTLISARWTSRPTSKLSTFCSSWTAS